MGGTRGIERRSSQNNERWFLKLLMLVGRGGGEGPSTGGFGIMSLVYFGFTITGGGCMHK